MGWGGKAITPYGMCPITSESVPYGWGWGQAPALTLLILRPESLARFLPDFCPIFARFLPDFCPIFARFLPDSRLGYAKDILFTFHDYFGKNWPTGRGLAIVEYGPPKSICRFLPDCPEYFCPILPDFCPIFARFLPDFCMKI